MSFARDIADLGRSLDTSALSNKNIIDNGAMQVAQRGASSTGVTAAGYYTADRWRLNYVSLGTWTLTQEADGPAGFANSTKIECTTADAAPAAGDFLSLEQRIISRDLIKLKFGSAGAVSLTLQKWVKTNKPGTYQVNLTNTVSSRRVGTTYTINSADTWEQVVLTFPPDSVGTFSDTIGIGMIIEFMLDSGSNYSTGAVPTVWEAADNLDRRAGATVNLGDTIGNYWQITGVQLEEGEEATPFEHMSYSQHLFRCLPYAWMVAKFGLGSGDSQVGPAFSRSATIAESVIRPPVPMRDIPTVEGPTVTGGYRFFNGTTYIQDTPPILGVADNTNQVLQLNALSGMAVSTGGRMYVQQPGSYILLSADL